MPNEFGNVAVGSDSKVQGDGLSPGLSKDVPASQVITPGPDAHLLGRQSERNIQNARLPMTGAATVSRALVGGSISRLE